MKSLKYKEHYIDNYNRLNNQMRKFTSYFVEMLDKANLDSRLTVKFLKKFGMFRYSFFKRTKISRNMYYSACHHIDGLLLIIKNLKPKL